MKLPKITIILVLIVAIKINMILICKKSLGFLFYLFVYLFNMFHFNITNEFDDILTVFLNGTIDELKNPRIAIGLLLSKNNK